MKSHAVNRMAFFTIKDAPRIECLLISTKPYSDQLPDVPLEIHLCN
jgi:hypothetical protein